MVEKYQTMHYMQDANCTEAIPDIFGSVGCGFESRRGRSGITLCKISPYKSAPDFRSAFCYFGDFAMGNQVGDDRDVTGLGLNKRAGSLRLRYSLFWAGQPNLANRFHRFAR
jgi:hypothetical protein